jgi:hypothetical protein
MSQTIRTSNGAILCGFKRRKEEIEEQELIEKTYNYVVIDAYTYNPIGVFDTLDNAKENGIKITDDKCIILKFKLNDKCTYTYDVPYEST